MGSPIVAPNSSTRAESSSQERSAALWCISPTAPHLTRSKVGVVAEQAWHRRLSTDVPHVTADDRRTSKGIPSVSVLMGVRNAESCVRRAVESIRTQTLVDWELIVVDDGSVDGTRAVLNRIASEDSRLVVLHHAKSRGLAHALNLAFSRASGRLIGRMDADDIAYPDRLETQVAFLTTHPEIDVLGTGIDLVDEMGLQWGTLRMPELHEQLQRLRYRKPVPVAHPTVVMRRAVLERLGGYDGRLQQHGEDADLWLRALRAGMQFHNLQECLLRYRVRRRPTLKTVLFFPAIQARAALREGHFLRFGGYSVGHLGLGLLGYLGLFTPASMRRSELNGA